MITVDDIKVWFREGKKKKATHLIVVGDSFSHEYYPVYVRKGEDPKSKEIEYNCKSMQSVKEIYKLSRSMDRQLKKIGYNFNY